MKTLNESLIDEFDEIIDQMRLSGSLDINIDIDKLRRIYKELLKYKDESDDFQKAARTVVNTILSREFNS